MRGASNTSFTSTILEGASNMGGLLIWEGLLLWGGVYRMLSYILQGKGIFHKHYPLGDSPYLAHPYGTESRDFISRIEKTKRYKQIR